MLSKKPLYFPILKSLFIVVVGCRQSLQGVEMIYVIILVLIFRKAREQLSVDEQNERKNNNFVLNVNRFYFPLHTSQTYQLNLYYIYI